MRIVLYIILFFFINCLSAQDSEKIQQEIDKELWQPFKKAFETLNANKLNALYADQVLRVTPNGIDTENNFKAANLNRFAKNKANGIDIQLDFWFDSRHSNMHSSYEVGFYRMRLTTTSKVQSIYGQFHIVLEKIKGQWKITQDWDTTKINGKELSAEDFEQQAPVRFE